MPKDEFERRVRAYLLEHPEIIAEAISRLESQHAAREATEARALTKSFAIPIVLSEEIPTAMSRSSNSSITTALIAARWCR